MAIAKMNCLHVPCKTTQSYFSCQDFVTRSLRGGARIARAWFHIPRKSEKQENPMRHHRSFLLFVVSIAFLFVSAPRIPAQTFTLEQVMSSPFPSDLTVSKRADKIAWAFDAEGKRNIWIAEAPLFAARQRGALQQSRCCVSLRHQTPRRFCLRVWTPS